MQPDILIAGDTLNFLTETPGYSAADGWVLTLYLIKRATGGSITTIVGSAEGANHRFTVSATTTAGWTAGDYSWAGRVAKGSEKYSIENVRQQLVVLQDPATAVNGFDGRSQAEKALADAKTALAAWSPTTRRYKIGEREMEFSSKGDIVGLIHYWQNELARERRAAALAKGMPDPMKSYVRINRE